EGTVRPVLDATITPVLEGTVRPVLDATITPVVDATVTPVLEGTVRPVLDATITPVLEGTVTPVLEGTVTPVVDATLAPVLNVSANLDEVDAGSSTFAAIIQIDSVDGSLTLHQSGDIFEQADVRTDMQVRQMDLPTGQNDLAAFFEQASSTVTATVHATAPEKVAANWAGVITPGSTASSFVAGASCTAGGNGGTGGGSGAAGFGADPFHLPGIGSGGNQSSAAWRLPGAPSFDPGCSPD
ncbi:hypothetical protein, partial [Arthrobacter pigmenti]